MKKILVLVLVVLMIFSSFALAGCDKENEPDTTTTTTKNTTTTTTTRGSTTTKTENTTTTTPVTTTTTTNSTTTTTVKKTLSDDELAEQMRLSSKHIEYFVIWDDDLFISSKYEPDYRMVRSYKEYRQLMIDFNIWKYDVEDFEEYHAEKFDEAFNEYTEDFFEDNMLLLIENPSAMKVLHETRIDDICLNGNNLNVYIYEDSGGSVGSDDSAIFFIKVPKKLASRIENINITVNCPPYIEDEFIPAEKPIIYLYPEEETNVCVKLGYKEKITVSYPEYVDGWNVLAKPDGKLVYTETGRNLYSLYYECQNTVKFKIQKDGFVVKKEDTIAFLEEKLALLGLNEYEAEEFIIYWLPVLQENEYNYIRFATADEIERNMPLEINPNPDTIIRVLMTFKGLNAPIEVEEQKLTTPERTGFVAVEWGGTEIR